MAPLLEPPPPRPDAPANDDMSPEERAAIFAQMDRVYQEKQAALHAPGPTWREWFFFDAMKWWLGLAYFIVDAWIVSAWLEGTAFVIMIVLLIGAVYLEFLLYRYLWYRPTESGRRTRGAFHRTWARPVEYGRWTPEGELVRSGQLVPNADEGPNPKEFV